MQPFAEKYIDKRYANKTCHQCDKEINSYNTTLKSIIVGKQKYGNPVCESCSKGGNVFIIKCMDLGESEDDMGSEDKSIGSESVPSTVFTVRQHARVNTAKQTKTAVRPFKKRKFLQA